MSSYEGEASAQAYIAELEAELAKAQWKLQQASRDVAVWFGHVNDAPFDHERHMDSLERRWRESCRQVVRYQPGGKS